MKHYTVVFLPGAERDLDSLAAYISEQSGPGRALPYIRRLRAFCAKLDIFPVRGVALPDGDRLLGFEDSANIRFHVGETTVEIVGVAYRGRLID